MAKLKLFGGTDPAHVASANAVAVIGLGRFGQSLALELMHSGTEVLGIDLQREITQELNGALTHVVTADATKEDVLRQLSIPDFERVVVAIGNDIEASILTTSLLLRFNVQHIWAKAVSEPHGAILEQLGVHHVSYPEKDMGKRIAHLVRGSMQDYIEIDEDFVLIKTTPPERIIGVSLGESRIRVEHGVTITAVKRPGASWTHASTNTVVHSGDTILIAGSVRNAERFSQLR